MRWVMVRVLPVPAPARMHTGPRTATAAARCSSSSPASTASAPVSASLLVCPAIPGVPTHPILPARADDPGEASPAGGCSLLLKGPAAPPSSWGGRPGEERGRIHPMSASASTVTMYTTDWCGYCFRLKKMMQRESIDFAEVNIEHDPQAAELVMRANGGNRTVPTLVFADGTALTHPSIDQVRAQLEQLSGA